ncbi:MAG: NhaA family Na+:H+ antiporter [Moritella sp.]
MPRDLIQFFRSESSGGVLLIIATVLAIVVANSGLAELYLGFLHTEVQFRVAEIDIHKPLVHWVNASI